MVAPIAIAIEALDITLKEAVNNSKIMNTLDKEISKALGLLVDLVLLPFLPLLVGAIIGLYSGIMELGRVWQEFIGVLPEFGAPFSEWAKWFADFDRKIIDLLPKLTQPFSLLGDFLAKVLLALLKKPFTDALIDIHNALVPWWNKWVTFVNDLNSAFKTLIGFDVGSAIRNIFDKISSYFTSFSSNFQIGFAAFVNYLINKANDMLKYVGVSIPNVETPSIPQSDTRTYAPSGGQKSTIAPNTTVINVNGDVYGQQKFYDIANQFLRGMGSEYKVG